MTSYRHNHFLGLFINLSERSRTGLHLTPDNETSTITPAFTGGLIDLSVLDLSPRRRQDCFSTQYFTSCIQALLLEDEKERLQEMVEYLGRKK